MVPVPEPFLKSVVFLCIDKRGQDRIVRREPHATGFFVKVPLDVDLMNRVEYVVTARHILEKARAESINGLLYVRFNLISGRFHDIETNIDDWVSHSGADVAAIRPPPLPEGLTSAGVDGVALSIEQFVGPGPRYEFKGDVTDIGEVEISPTVGTEIYFIGLFSRHYGKEVNLPVARFGHISRMPTEMEIESGGIHSKIVAYLCEHQSWGGHSGSPVFFMHPMMLGNERVGESGALLETRWDSAHLSGFMGLVSGHYELSERADVTGDLAEVQVKMNSGMAIVTPADAVRQLLIEREEFVADREKLKRTIGSA